MSDKRPTIWWVRRDLRLSDNPALQAALDSGGPVLPVFVHDEVVESHGACPKWRLGLGVDHFAKVLNEKGSRLILRRGNARDVIAALVEETHAKAVVWNRLYDPDAKARDIAVKSMLKDRDVDVASFGGHLLFEPWTVQTKTGDFYKVFTPMWKAVQGRDVPEPARAPAKLPTPETWPDSEDLQGWAMGAGMRRGASVVATHLRVGEDAARNRLHHFIADLVADYPTNRDIPSVSGTSRLSENLTYGEIGPRACWHAGLRALHQGKDGAEVFLKELVWREFAYHLVYHTPRIVSDNWRQDWQAFPWNTDETKPEVLAWKQGRTGIRFVDAAMREMYVTGTMHNRGRMIVASYLTKHLMTHWKIGMRWFEECLTDWDPASNAMGWQWSAGSGPDATPYFRVFNPVTQLEKFDPDHRYANAWIAEGQADPSATALSYFEAVPKRWGLSATDSYPQPVVTAEAGRRRALDAYENRGF